VNDAQVRYQGHTYFSVFKLPERMVITGGEIRVLGSEVAPDLSLAVHRITLADGSSPFPLRSEWISKRADARDDGRSERWVRVGEVEDVSVFENTRVLPRAWLSSSFEVLKENEILQVIRNGSFPNGDVWDPRRTALLEHPVELSNDIAQDTEASATVIEHDPNRILIRTVTDAPAIVVLSENFYPGWRAYVDGESTEILRVNYNLRGLALGAGEHSVEFVYRPYSVLIGLATSILMALVLILWVMGRFERINQAVDGKRRRLARRELAKYNVNREGQIRNRQDVN
jgi:hypothetical protein